MSPQKLVLLILLQFNVVQLKLNKKKCLELLIYIFHHIHKILPLKGHTIHASFCITQAMQTLTIHIHKQGMS